ncbi:MAG: hypothetical protein RL358_1280 [Pseudomonadota bacterium]
MMLQRIFRNQAIASSLLAMAFLWCGESFAAQPLRVLLLLSNNFPAYQAFSTALQQHMPAAQLHVRNLSELDTLPEVLAQYDVVVALGMPATQAVALQSDVPLLSVFVPESSYSSLLQKLKQPTRAAKMGGIYLNQPLSRQLDFIAALLPGQRKLGLLYSAKTEIDLIRLREESNVRRRILITQAIDTDQVWFSKMEDLLSQTEVLLAIPDSSIYSNSNVRNILLSTYRFNVPLIGFSANFVNAGALAAIFASPEQIAGQSAATLLKFSLGQHWAGGQYSNTFNIALNPQIARSLGIELLGEVALRQRMIEISRGAHD